MVTDKIGMIAAAIVLAACTALRADVDLNTFSHGGSMARPLAGTTASAEAVLGEAFDALPLSRADAILGSPFDSWWQFVGSALLNGRFSTFHLPLIFVVH